jgi:parallel beta-helix repeat protein
MLALVSPSEALADIPSNVVKIVFSITGRDSAGNDFVITREVPVLGQDEIVETFDVPNGSGITFEVKAYDAAGKEQYTGVAVETINGNATVSIIMERVEESECDLYVDVIGSNDNDCRNPGYPCLSIDYAVTQTDGDETICVAAGDYYLQNKIQLMPGTRFLCQGEGHTSVIYADYQEGYPGAAFSGSTGVSIEECKIVNASPAIDDNASVIQVIHNFIDGGACAGIVLNNNSLVDRNEIRNINSEGCDGYEAGIVVYADENNAPTITNNHITGNRNGIIVYSAGNPLINHNRIYCNTYVNLISFSSIQIDANYNSWNTDEATNPSGPLVYKVSGAEESCIFNMYGVDICYDGAIPSYENINPAEPGAVQCIPR